MNDVVFEKAGAGTASGEALQSNRGSDFGLEERYGFIPRFLAGDGSDHARLIDAVRSTRSLSLDFRALNVFLRTGLFLNGATPFNEIRRFSPSPIFVSASDLSYQQASEQYIALFRQAVARRAQSQAAIGLSGGCDSRHIVLELYRQKQLPEYAVTLDLPERPEEAKLASELSRHLHIRHVVLKPEPGDCVKDEIWKDYLTDFMSLEHGWLASVGRARDSLDWWDGIGGDVLSAGLFLEEWNLRLFEENRIEELANALVLKQPVPFFRDQSLFPPEDALSEITLELAKHAKAPNPVGSFYFWNRTRVNISACAFGLLQPKQQRTLAPYLDQDLWALLASLPARMLVNHRFHIDVLKTAYPEFASIPFSHEKIRADIGIQRQRGLELLKYLWRSRGGFSSRTLAAVSLFARFLYPHRLIDIDWMLPLFVYSEEIQALFAKAGLPDLALSNGAGSRAHNWGS